MWPGILIESPYLRFGMTGSNMAIRIKKKRVQFSDAVVSPLV